MKGRPHRPTMIGFDGSYAQVTTSRTVNRLVGSPGMLHRASLGANSRVQRWIVYGFHAQSGRGLTGSRHLGNSTWHMFIQVSAYSGAQTIIPDDAPAYEPVTESDTSLCVFRRICELPNVSASIQPVNQIESNRGSEGTECTTAQPGSVWQCVR